MNLIKIINIETLAKNLTKKCIIFIIILYYLASGKPMALFTAAVNKNCILEWLKNLKNVFSEKKAANIYNPALIKHMINLESGK